MKKILFSIILGFLGICLSCSVYAQSSSVSYQRYTIRGVPADVISIDLKDPHIIVAPVVSERFPHAPEDFESMVSRVEPTAAINGNFFCKRTYKPVGDIVIDGKLIYFGGLGTAMGITEDNRVEFIKVERYRHMNWSRYKTVISCGPQLIENGKIVLDPKGEGFKDPNLFSRRNRSAVGVTWDRKLLFVTVNSGIYFEDLALIMKDLGCKDAMNLDGGGSSGLYYKGEMLMRPNTELPDILVVHEKEFAPNVLITLREKMAKDEKRVEILSSLAMIINKDQFLVKGLKDGKVYIIMKFDNPHLIEAPQLDAKIDAETNKVTIKIPFEKLKDIFKQSR